MRRAGELDALIAKAMRAHQAGRLAEAQKSYKAVLREAPKHFPTLHLLGLTYFQDGKADKGIEFVQRALALKPDFAEAHYNLAIALHGLKRFEEAIKHYNSALAIHPNNPDAYNNLGAALHELHRHEEAIEQFRKALVLRPGLAQSHNNLGSALKEMHRYEEAVQHFEASLAVHPNNPETLCNLGAVLLEGRRFEESLAAYAAASAAAPNFSEAELGCGSALFYLGRFEDAVIALDRAVAIKPDVAKAWLARGYACRELNRYGDALSSFDRALACDPDLEYVRGDRLHLKMGVCDWTDFDAARDDILASLQAGKLATLPWPFLAVADAPEAQLKCARLHAQRRFPASRDPMWKGERYAHERIRVGYVSADLCDHVVARLVAELLERHDRSRFEIFAFSLGPDDGSAMRARLTRIVDHFIDVHRKSDREVARLMRDNEIDIAVDLMGFTQNSRFNVFAMRPAPLQLGYLGYAGTTGADYIDYVMADPVIAPSGHHGFYAEKVAWLRDSAWLTDTTRPMTDAPMSRQEAGLPERGFVFCSFNNSYKFTPEVFDVWMRLLRNVDDSVLWLLASRQAADNLRREAEKRGIAADRLVFAPRVDLDAHLARHRLADLFVDTLPYNAHATATDALWAGLPVLTCTGSTFASRVAASTLTAIGLPELVTHSLPDYEALALKLAREPALLAAIRSRLAANRLSHPLFDVGKSARDLEALYTAMWQRQQNGQAPEPLSIAGHPG